MSARHTLYLSVDLERFASAYPDSLPSQVRRDAAIIEETY